MLAEPRPDSSTPETNWRPSTTPRGRSPAATSPASAWATSAGNAGRFQYTGQAWLTEAGLYHYRARAYLPQIGRFLQTDPIGYAAGANLYAYVGADPVNWIDPFGLQHARVPCLMPTPDRFACADIWVDGRRVPPAEFYLGDGSLGGRGSFGRRGGGSGFGYRPRFNPVQNDPAFAPYQAERLQAIHDNQWMVWLVLAPEAVVGLAEAGTALTARAVAKACNCFEADTVVTTDRGPRSIQDIVVGDLVLARDEHTDETAFKPVIALIDGAERQIWEVIVETVDAEGAPRRETIGTTDEHPWRLVGGDWATTAELYPGAELVTASGHRAVVVSVVRTDRVERTFNLEVEGFHTYFVGEGRVWVHNTCKVPIFRCIV
ncbi:MAG: hypothetical protein IE935_16625, partial [Micrococcales bacterium]|nr:hypothetical protein [Micrococcales bacterium]